MNCEAGVRDIKFRVDIKPDHPDDNLIIMQYTGLKDKNGKEIYEVKHYCITIDRGSGTYEIIGNIHETPELLKDEHDESS